MFFWLTYCISFTLRILNIPDVGKAWGQEKKEETEDEMVGWHHWLNGHESEQTPGDSEGQGNLLCYSPCCHEESDMTEQHYIYIYHIYHTKYITSIKLKSFYFCHIFYANFNSLCLSLLKFLNCITLNL